MAREPRKPRIRRRRIIERPRLIRALDRSEARVRMLVADSGWGKTTLAEQWAAREGSRVGWYRARRSAADVSVVARGLVAAADEIVPGAGSRLLQRLSVTADPEREATLLAEMLAEDLEDWPSDGWIVIDDYQHLAASTASEAFVETVVSRSTVQLLVAADTRPAWASPTAVLSGEVLEVPEVALAMTADEVNQVLRDTKAALGPGLIALARGWPALVGLAGMTPDAQQPDAALPDALYEFFADELWCGLEPTVRTGLAILAEMPLVDRELAITILGEERADEVCDEAMRLGILDERAGYLEFHPLAAAFFERKMPGYLPNVVRRASAHYRGRGELDAAFDLTERAGAPTDVDMFVSESMEELLNRARLPTLEQWVFRAGTRVGETGTLLLAQAEIALRRGRHLAAQALSERVLREDDKSLMYRAYLAGAKAAHVGGREKAAMAFFLNAERAAPDEDARRGVKWGELTAAIDLELDRSHDLFHDLETTATHELDATESIQTADKRLLIGLRFGSIPNLSEAKRVAELLPSVADPVLRCSFGSTFSCALNLAAEYTHALRVATTMIEDATECRVGFALSYGYLMRGAALAGLRHFDEAHVALSESLEHAFSCADTFAQQAVYAGRVRAFLQEARIAEACALEPPDLSESLPAMRGEVWGSRALALACLGRLEEAQACVREFRGKTRAVEPRMLTYAVASVIALKARDPASKGILRDFVATASSAGGVDFIVTAYRANPDLLAAVLRDPVTAEGAGYVVSRASDRGLVDSLGIDLLATVDPASFLTRREREVYELLCEGFGNAEMARRLFISPATVKVHVRHVYDKLGIRSRTALALNAASRRSQATAAGGTEATSSDIDG
jgi:DNA-binding CsgD family transcriptional regulator/tetratricopeptide (TPR) repeat protein